MKHDYKYLSHRVQLRPLEQEDIEPLRILRNQNRQYFLSQQEITKKEQEEWYRSYLTRMNDIMFKIAKNDAPSVFIGAIALYDIDMELKTAEFGRVVVDKVKAPETGIGTEAVRAICLFGFNELHLEKIVCEVLMTNERAIKAYQNVGFHIVTEREGMYHMELLRDA